MRGGLPERHALVWRGGEARPVTLYCPPYWDIAACRRVARVDPFHPKGMPRAAGSRGRLLRGLTAGALGVMAAAYALSPQHRDLPPAGDPPRVITVDPPPMPMPATHHRRHHAMR